MNFISDLSALIAEISTRYEHILILGDFNIHICCPDKPLSTDFLKLIDAFGLIRSMNAPNHVHTHTLDRVQSSG